MKTRIVLSFLLFFSYGLKAQKFEWQGTETEPRLFISSEGLPIYAECPTNIPPDYFEQDRIINGLKIYVFPAKVFEVSRSSKPHGTENFEYGYDYCKGLVENGGNWRLPNQKELFMIFALSTAIQLNQNFPPFYKGYHLTGLISNKDGAFPYPRNLVDLEDGNSISGGSSLGYSVRCVRDTW